jgi:hypothetical protein
MLGLYYERLQFSSLLHTLFLEHWRDIFLHQLSGYPM